MEAKLEHTGARVDPIADKVAADRVVRTSIADLAEVQAAGVDTSRIFGTIVNSVQERFGISQPAALRAIGHTTRELAVEKVRQERANGDKA